MKSPLWWRKAMEQILPRRRLRIVEGDSLPPKLPWRDIVLARDAGEDWSAGMRCPCGCGQTIELMLIPEVKPHWNLSVDVKERPTLKPSVWRKTGCHSHFWLKQGRVHWCD